MALPNPTVVKSAIDVELEKYGGQKMTPNQMVAVLNQVALRFDHMGLHHYEGDHGDQPVTGIHCTTDVLRYLPPGEKFGVWADVLVAAGTGHPVAAAPDWKPSTDDDLSFVKPVVVGDQGGGGGDTGGGSGGSGLDEAAIRKIAQDEARKALAHVAIKSNRGHYLRDDWADDAAKFDRTEAGGGETFTIEVK